MTQPKRHHFVPRWYLENFTDPDHFLHVHDLNTGLWRKQRPNQVMLIGNYYRQTWAPKGIDPSVFEKTLGAVSEPKAQDAFKRLIVAPNNLTDDDMASMLTYLELQRIRVSKQAKIAKEIFRSVLLQHAPTEVVDAVRKREVLLTIKDSARFDFMKMAIGQFHPWFARMEWQVIEAAAGSSFITTDNPVSFLNQQFLPPSEPGIALLGTVVLFPLTSRHLLILRHPEFLTQSDVDLVLRIPEPEVEDGVIAITRGGIWSEREVSNLNWVMRQLADQLVVANSQHVIEQCAHRSQ